MNVKLLTAAGLVGLGLALSSAGANASPLTRLDAPTAATNQSLAEPVGYRTYCHRWRHECAERWPGLGWRFRRCMSFHGCY